MHRSVQLREALEQISGLDPRNMVMKDKVISPTSSKLPIFLSCAEYGDWNMPKCDAYEIKQLTLDTRIEFILSCTAMALSLVILMVSAFALAAPDRGRSGSKDQLGYVPLSEGAVRGPGTSGVGSNVF